MNNYEQIRCLGEGGYGKAILFRRKSDNSHVVIKEIKFSSLNAKDKQDALNEVAVLSALKHPNIVEYIESFQERGCLFIVMEFADGGDLSQKIEKQGTRLFREDEILDIFIQMALAIKYIHDRKVLHRDLKSQNIFLTKQGKVKLGDFGIARVLDNTMQLCKTQIGTPYYLSPEICEGKQYNTKTDVWSLGCILYELCTLKHAFDARNMNALLMNIVRGKYTPIPNIYSSELNSLVSSMLIKDPKMRPHINSILSLPIIRTRLAKFLSDFQMQKEMEHTILHGVNPLKPPPPTAREHIPPAIPVKPPPKEELKPKPKPPSYDIPSNVDPRYYRIQMAKKAAEEQNQRKSELAGKPNRPQQLEENKMKVLKQKIIEVADIEMKKLDEENERFLNEQKKINEEKWRIDEEEKKQRAERNRAIELENHRKEEQKRILEQKKIEAENYELKKRKEMEDIRQRQREAEERRLIDLIEQKRKEEEAQRIRNIEREKVRKNLEEQKNAFYEREIQKKRDMERRRELAEEKWRQIEEEKKKKQRDIEAFQLKREEELFALKEPHFAFNRNHPNSLDDSFVLGKLDQSPGWARAPKSDERIVVPPIAAEISVEDVRQFQKKQKVEQNRMVRQSKPFRTPRLIKPDLLRPKNADHDNLESTIREALNIQQNEEPVDIHDKRPNIIALRNKELHLPVANDLSSMCYRAEAIRVALEKEIGVEKLLALKRELSDDTAERRVTRTVDNEILMLMQQLLYLDDTIEESNYK